MMYTPLLCSLICCASVFALNGYQPTVWLLPTLPMGLLIGLLPARVIGEFMSQVRVQENNRVVRSMHILDSSTGVYDKASGVVRGDVSYCLLIANCDGTFSPVKLSANAFNTCISEGDDEKVGSLIITRVVTDPNSRLAKWGFCDPPPNWQFQITVPKGTLSTSFKLQ